MWQVMSFKLAYKVYSRPGATDRMVLLMRKWEDGDVGFVVTGDMDEVLFREAVGYIRIGRSELLRLLESLADLPPKRHEKPRKKHYYDTKTGRLVPVLPNGVPDESYP